MWVNETEDAEVTSNYTSTINEYLQKTELKINKYRD
jgi:hypothetical protein